jgi:SWI/SNF-related matrix-associated actin-dependent regulator of chromatin subfamily A-like protein 1
MSTVVAKNVILNNYAGPCCKCGQHVPADGPDRGYAVKEDRWNRYCKVCVPVKINMERKLTSDGLIIMPFERESLDLLRSIPGSWFDRTVPAWRVSLKESDRARVLEVARQLKLEIAPELDVVIKSESGERAETAGLYPFQVEGVDWLSKGTHRLLADDMGLGKTVQTLMALPKGCCALAVVPAAVKYNWRDEAKRWRPDLDVFVANGKNQFRLPGKNELVICNFDILPTYVEPVKKTPTSKPWDVEVRWPNEMMKNHIKDVILIIDEAQRVKNYKTKRSQRVKGLAMSCAKVWALSGTPLENRPEDLYGTLESLQMQKVVFGGWNRFVELMNGWRNSWGGYEWGSPKPIVPELMRRVMLRRIRTEVLPDLPTKTYSNLKVDLPKTLSNRLDDLWDQYGDVISSKELPPFEEFSGIRAELAASRIEALTELVEEHEEDNIPLVVFSSHLAPLNELAKRDGWDKITGETSAANRQEVVRRFQNGELKGVAVSIRAGGVGLTLTRAWKSIFVDMDWVPSANQQAEDRICRIGQTSNKCEIVRMVSNHVLDQHVQDLIAWKMNLIDKSINETIKVNVQEVESETDEEYEERMKLARSIAEANMTEEEEDMLLYEPVPMDEEIPF